MRAASGVTYGTKAAAVANAAKAQKSVKALTGAMAAKAFISVLEIRMREAFQEAVLHLEPIIADVGVAAATPSMRTIQHMGQVAT